MKVFTRRMDGGILIGWIEHDAIEDVEGEFERYSSHSVLIISAQVRFRLINTDRCWGAAIQGVSIRTGLDKCPVLYGYKTFVVKTGQILHYRERKPFNFCVVIYHGLYNVRYSPLHIINYCYYATSFSSL